MIGDEKTKDEFILATQDRRIFVSRGMKFLDAARLHDRTWRGSLALRDSVDVRRGREGVTGVGLSEDKPIFIVYCARGSFYNNFCIRNEDATRGSTSSCTCSPTGTAA